MLISGGFELPLLDGNVEDKPRDTADQRGNDAHLGYNSGTAERPDRRLAKNGIVLLERAVGSLGYRTESMQLPIRIGPSRYFQDELGGDLRTAKRKTDADYVDCHRFKSAKIRVLKKAHLRSPVFPNLTTKTSKTSKNLKQYFLRGL